jgi:hypothetical protein
MPATTRITDPKLQLAVKHALQQGPGIDIQRMGPGLPQRGTFLIYGPPGSGKTTFAGTFPDPFFVDIEGGVEAVRDKRVAYIQPQSYLELLLSTVPESIAEYKTYVLDTATETVRLIMDHCLRETGREASTLAEWMMTIEYFRRLMRGLKDLTTMHIVVIAQEATIKDEETGKVMIGPALPGKLFHETAALFDCVFPMKMAKLPNMAERSRVLLTEPEGLYMQARSRFKGLARYEEPNFLKLWEKIHKHSEKEVSQNAKA